jgi:hypothetical protein
MTAALSRPTMRATRCLPRSMDDWIAASKHVKEVQSDILNVERQRSLEVTLPKWAAFEDLEDGFVYVECCVLLRPVSPGCRRREGRT